MAKAKKITTDELEGINGIISKMRDNQMRYGALSLQIASINDTLSGLRTELATLESSMNEQRTGLQEKYGDVNIDLQTGVISEQEVAAE
jgi:hypothetical protein